MYPESEFRRVKTQLPSKANPGRGAEAPLKRRSTLIITGYNNPESLSLPNDS